VNATGKNRLRVFVQHGMFVVLACVLAALVMLIAREHRTEWDISASARNTLTAASLETLRKLDGPVTITAYATPQDPRLGDLRKLIRDLIARYQRAKPDVRLVFIDPREQPKATQQAGVQVNGELVVEYANRSERLSSLSELELTNLLIRLARAGERLIMSLDGHGERSLIGGANHDLGDFGKQLAVKGLKVTTLNLAIAPEVPENTAVLVIANPQTPVAPGEIEKLVRFIEAGGNIMWLIDHEPLYGLEVIAERLGIMLSPGIVVDPDSIERGGRPVMSVAAAGAYGTHPIVESFRLNTLFPFARAIGIQKTEDLIAQPLIEVAPRGWIETDGLEGRIVYDKGRDVAGPVTIAFALERLRNERTQRIVVVGSGHFLANIHLGNGGNADLGINMVNWLTGDDRLIAIQPRSAPDTTLALSKSWLFAIVAIFLIVLPIVLLATGGFIWWRRRRA
jgi:ABC-type uncharacterized transport system involved in gliding motility auxiliary subunit